MIKKIIETQSSKAEFLVKKRSLQNRSNLDFLYSHNKDGTVTIESYQGNEREIIIPEKLNGKNVTIVRLRKKSVNCFLIIKFDPFC